MTSTKLCVVAGAGPGMGYAIARTFARNGFDIALLARRQPELDVAAANLETLGIRAQGFAADLTEPADIARAFTAIRASLGNASVMVHNASVMRQIPAMEIDPLVFARDVSLCVNGALVCAQQVYPAMKAARAGTMLFTGGGLALHPEFGAGISALTAGKCALRGLILALAKELQPDSIKVATVTIAGAVTPGTPFDPDLIAAHYWALHNNPNPPAEVVFDGKS